MPTNAEIKANILKYVRAQRSHILTDDVAQILEDMVDNIAAGAGTPTLAQVLTAGNNAGGQEITSVSLFESVVAFPGGGLIVRAPNDAPWLITVDNSGAIITTAL